MNTNQTTERFFPGFKRTVVAVGDGVTINTLLTGTTSAAARSPETQVAWWKVAPKLAERFTDLRGYGDSSKPDGTYSKREMAED